MKTPYFLYFGIMLAHICTNTHAATSTVCVQMASTSYCSGGFPTQGTGVQFELNGSVSMPGCSNMVSQCWETVSGTYAPWYTCNTCQSGYTRTQTSATMVGCGTSYYYYCKENCTGCTNCASDTSWSAGNTGYEKKVTRTCNCNTCLTSGTSYRCAAGYYGSSTNGTSGCTRCPSSGGVYGTSAAGSTAITDCYIPAGDISWTDDTGTYVCGEDSYYSN